MTKSEVKAYYSLTKYDWALIVVLIIAYYFMIRQYICAVDDVMYSYFRTSSGIDWSRPITSLCDAINSQKTDYFTRNGRVEIHTIVQLFCSMWWGRQVFFVLSSLAFGSLIGGVIKTIRYLNNGRCLSVLSFVVLLFLVPIPGQTFMGNIAFSMNYLWTSAASVWIIYFFLRIKDGAQYNTVVLWLIVLFAICAGAMHEGFSLPISGMMFFYLCFNFKKAPKPLIYLIVAYWLGTLLTVTAPANFSRANETSYLLGYGQSFVGKAITVTTSLLKGQLLVQLFVLICIVGLIFRKRMVNIINAYWYFVVIGLLVLSFDIFVAYVGEHQLTPLAVATSIIIVGSVSRLIVLQSARTQIIINCALIVMSGIFYVSVLNTRIQIKQEWDRMHEVCSKSGETYANAHDLFLVINDIPDYKRGYEPIRDLMLHTCNKHFFEKLTSVMATNGRDPEKIQTVLPDSKENITALCSSADSISQYIYFANNYYVIRTPLGYDLANSMLNYVYKPGIFGALLRKFGRQGAIQTLTPTMSAHAFSDENYQYSIVFLEPERIEKIWLE